MTAYPPRDAASNPAGGALALDPSRHFPRDYEAGRSAFLRGAQARGAQLSSWPIAARAPGGGELAIDVAYLGPAAPARLLAVSSGIHGVEGFAGSAVQHALLERLEGLALPADSGLLLIHALNPFGFAHLRRVNERNVDLNRNFVRHPDEHRPNPGYDALGEAINPASLDPESEERSRRALLAFASQHGFPELQRVLTCGQYAHPRGMQYGGARAEASNLALREIVRAETRGAPRIAWLDVHTGLGPFGEIEMITELPREHPMVERGRAWWGDAARSTVSGESASAPLHGVMELAVEAELPPGCELTIFTAEFGTVEASRAFWAMRADNWLHHHGDPGSAQGRGIRAEMLAVFQPADPAWQRQVLEGAVRALEQARDGLVRG